jgi:hypothetical protein
MSFEPQLVPALREGIDIIKMVLFRELKGVLISRHPAKDSVYINQLTGAVVNDLFGVSFMDEASDAFIKTHPEIVQKTSLLISTELDNLRIPLTDALRIQYLCDSHEGIDSRSVLKRAEQRGILIVEREAPLPGAFMHIVRTFGRAYAILKPPTKMNSPSHNGR